MKTIGSKLNSNTCTFTVWAPFKKCVEVHIITPIERYIPMVADEFGYWNLEFEDIFPGTLYKYRLDSTLERPDPASRFQPQGVHGPSMVIDQSHYAWQNKEPFEKDLNDYIIYEMHIGTFTPEGTFESARNHIPNLVNLGITAVEIMPVAQFPGNRNWGYDGAYPFAVQNSYGGVDAMKAFIDDCHSHNLAVILDVVYNHIGPEGNYFRDFGPYFTDKYKIPWGEAINFDGPYSDCVSNFFINNALYWLHDFRVDALRIDAVHAICDMGARPFLLKLSETIKEEFTGRKTPKYLIAESDLNDSRIIQSRNKGGFELNAQWNDDFHHALHAMLTGESRGYYGDYGTIDHLYRAFKNAFCYAGEYSVMRKRSHGNSVSDFHTGKFVVCSQNHDQAGNRMLGERLISLTDFNQARLAAATVLLSPYIPLLFMGEEHAEDHPFLFFVDHGNKSLKEAVIKGRKEEFSEFHNFGEPANPFDIEIFNRCKVDWSKRRKIPGSTMLLFYKELIRLRKSLPALGPHARNHIETDLYPNSQVISIHYKHSDMPVVCIFNFGKSKACITWKINGKWNKIFDSNAPEWGDTEIYSLPNTIHEKDTLHLAPFSCALYSY